MDKQTLRREMKGRRSKLDPQTALRLSEKICSRILAWSIYARADVILGYFPTGSEADIKAVLLAALQQGKKVALPKVFGQRHMEFLYINGFNDLEKGAMNLWEPAIGCSVFDPLSIREQQTLMLVPGLAFCQDGQDSEPIGRLGYGGGFYDTYLSRITGGKISGSASCHLAACGVAYDVQKISCQGFPLESHDLFIKYLVTEKSIYGQEEIR